MSADLTPLASLARELRHQAVHALPPHLDSLVLDGLVIGHLSRRRALALRGVLPGLAPEQRLADPLSNAGMRWSWHAGSTSPDERTQALQHAAERLKDQGLITGWRDEQFSYWPEDAVPFQSPELFRLERSAFRALGLRSHAVHINAFTPDGRMWCSRRSFSKPTDPGMLDNLAAGGLPSDEIPRACAIRELWEEAGVPAALAENISPDGEIVTAQLAGEDWVHERIFVFHLALPADFVPGNQDGEVAEFMLLEERQLVNHLQQGHFTHEAACTIAQGYSARLAAP